jgi:hypothetical protein
MSKPAKWGAVLLVVGILLGAGGAEAWRQLAPSFLNVGLFTLGKGETALFNVTLDDARGTSASTVLMELIDARGAVVARQSVLLAAGQSATLRYDIPGIYRAHAEIVATSTLFTNRRRLITTLEIQGDPLGGLAFPRIYVCSASDDGAGNGRLPD